MRLTPRQHQVAALVADDLTVEEIANRLEPRCSVRTVEAHVNAIAEKIRASGYRFQKGGLRLVRRWMKDQAA
jgi:DNA-binding NarL/FixJ family response regulator